MKEQELEEVLVQEEVKEKSKLIIYNDDFTEYGLVIFY